MSDCRTYIEAFSRRASIFFLATAAVALLPLPAQANESFAERFPHPNIEFHATCSIASNGTENFCRHLLKDSGRKNCTADGDRRLCEMIRLDSGNYEMIAMDREFLEELVRFRPQILAAAEKFSLDPKFLFVVFAGMQEWQESQIRKLQLRESTILHPDGTVSLTSFTELRDSTKFLEVAEQILAEAEERTLKDRDEVAANSRLSDLGFFDYLAATLVYLRKELAKAHPEHIDNPAAITSLYWAIAQQTNLPTMKTLGYPLGPDGWFLSQNMELIEAVWNAALKPKALSIQAVEASRMFPSIIFSPVTTIQRDYFEKSLTIISSVSLYFRPTICGNPEERFDEGIEIDSARAKLRAQRDTEYFPKGTTGRGPFEILYQTHSCNEDWSLISFFKSGAIGWVRDSDLDKVQVVQNSLACTRKEYLEHCFDQIAESIGEEEILGIDLEKNQVAIKLVGFPDISNIVDYNQFRDRCLEEAYREENRSTVLESLTENRANTGAEPTTRAKPRVQPDIEIPRFRRDVYKGRPVSEVYPDHIPLTPEFRRYLDEKVLGLITQFQLHFGYDPFAPGDELSTILAWYSRIQRICHLDCLVKKKAEFETFFNLMDISNFRDPEHKQRMLNQYSSYAANEVGNERFGPLEPIIDHTADSNRKEIFHNQTLAEQINELNQACAVARTILPNFRRNYDILVENYRASTKGHKIEDQLGFSVHAVLNILNSCELVEKIYFRRRGLTELAPLDFQYSYANSFPITSKVLEGDTASFDLRYLLGINPPNSFLEELLNNILSNLQSHLGEILKEASAYVDRYYADSAISLDIPIGLLQRGVRDPVFSCLYNPIASDKRISEILKLPCVAGVIIPPEKYLEKKFSDPNFNAVRLPYPERDRVLLQISRECM